MVGYKVKQMMQLCEDGGKALEPQKPEAEVRKIKKGDPVVGAERGGEERVGMTLQS